MHYFCYVNPVENIFAVVSDTFFTVACKTTTMWMGGGGVIPVIVLMLILSSVNDRNGIFNYPYGISKCESYKWSCQ